MQEAVSVAEPAKGGSGFVEAGAVVPTHKMRQEAAAGAATGAENPRKMWHDYQRRYLLH